MTATLPFRFGVLGEHLHTPDALVRTAQQAERLGYNTLLLRDHFVREPFGDQPAPMIALMAAAAATSRLRIGTVVLANDYRHPVMLAKEAATLDVLSGGRFELGLGAGWLRDEYERAGMPFDLARVRVDRLEESLVVLKGLLAGEEVTFEGEHYAITSLSTFPIPSPTPSRRPHPPIQIGAGSKRMLRLAGREADTVGILPRALPQGAISDALSERTPEAMKQKIEWVREGAGARMDEVELSMVISPLIDDDRYAAAGRYAGGRDWGRLPADRVLEMPAAFLGPPEYIAETMRARREEFGFSYYIVPDAVLERFAPVVERLAGT